MVAKKRAARAKARSSTVKRKRSRAAAAPSAVAAASLAQFNALTAMLQESTLFARTAAVLPVDPAAGGQPAGPPASALALPDLLNTRLQSVRSSGAKDLQKLAFKVDQPMDPRLQLAIANHRMGKPGLSLSSTTNDEVAVVARVTSVDEWKSVPDVFPGGELGKDKDGGWIVTGRVPVNRIEAVRASPAVLSLKASQSIHPSLAKALPAMGLQAGGLPAGTSPQGGKGIVVGVIDFGCDFAHRNFRFENGKTRLLALWDQSGTTQSDSPFSYGRLYQRAEIDAALLTTNPYMTLRYGPSPADLAGGSHGTHVMDIAAGNGLGSGQAGVAPMADIVFVEAASTDVPWQGPTTVNKAFGDSVQLLEAVRFVFDTAGDRPCVCNLSLGTNGGPHDGTSLVEQGLDAIVREKPNRAIVIAASNSQMDNIHTSGTVPPNGPHDIVWAQQDEAGGEFELWYAGQRRLAVTLIAGDGTAFGPVAPGDTLSMGATGQIAVFISNRLNDPNNHDNVIGIWLAKGLGGTDWTVRLTSVDGVAVDYHAWIERDDRTQASFKVPVPTHTLGSISTGQESIVVGSYNAHLPQFPLSTFSSSGPTRDGRNKPEVSAPGQNVMAAKSGTVTGVVRKSGTSMAAPAVTGLIALIFAEARRQNRNLTIAQLRAKLLGNTLRNPPAVPANGWDPRYGNGRAHSAAI